jgi:hypothetical protein
MTKPRVWHQRGWWGGGSALGEEVGIRAVAWVLAVAPHTVLWHKSVCIAGVGWGRMLTHTTEEEVL